MCALRTAESDERKEANKKENTSSLSLVPQGCNEPIGTEGTESLSRKKTVEEEQGIVDGGKML